MPVTDMEGLGIVAKEIYANWTGTPGDKTQADLGDPTDATHGYTPWEAFNGDTTGSAEGYASTAYVSADRPASLGWFDSQQTQGPSVISSFTIDATQDKMPTVFELYGYNAHTEVWEYVQSYDISTSYASETSMTFEVDTFRAYSGYRLDMFAPSKLDDTGVFANPHSIASVDSDIAIQELTFNVDSSAVVVNAGLAGISDASTLANVLDAIAIQKAADSSNTDTLAKVKTIASDTATETIRSFVETEVSASSITALEYAVVSNGPGTYTVTLQADGEAAITGSYVVPSGSTRGGTGLIKDILNSMTAAQSAGFEIDTQTTVDISGSSVGAYTISRPDTKNFTLTLSSNFSSNQKFVDANGQLQPLARGTPFTVDNGVSESDIANSTPTLSDYRLLGVTTYDSGSSSIPLDADNLAAINELVAEQATAFTGSALQTLLDDANNVARLDAIAKIAAYAADDLNDLTTYPQPSVTDYEDLGIRVTSGELSTVNGMIVNKDAVEVDTIDEIADYTSPAVEFVGFDIDGSNSYQDSGEAATNGTSATIGTDDGNSSTGDSDISIWLDVSDAFVGDIVELWVDGVKVATSAELSQGQIDSGTYQFVNDSNSADVFDMAIYDTAAGTGTADDDKVKVQLRVTNSGGTQIQELDDAAWDYQW
jgi:hypothetical protein